MFEKITKFSLNLNIILFTLIFGWNTAIAGEEEHKFALEDHPGYVKYEEPTKGTAEAKMMLEGSVIVMEIYSPAWNFHGVDTAPNKRSDTEKKQVQLETERFISEPNKFFRYEPRDYCALRSIHYKLDQITTGEKQGKSGGESWRTFDVIAEAVFDCAGGVPEKMAVDLFSAFPRLKELNVQMIVNDAKVKRVILTEEKPVVVIIPSAE